MGRYSRLAPVLNSLAAGVLFVAGLGRAQPGSAGINSWTSAGPDGGYIIKTIYNPSSPAAVYLAAQSGFYSSTDGGTTWSLIDGTLNGAPTDMEIDPSNPDRVYLGTQGSVPALWESSDGGATLTPVTSYPQSEAAAQAITVGADGASVYVADGLSILLSLDHGQTWQKRTPVSTQTGSVFKLLVSSTNANTVIAMALVGSSGLQLFISHDGATTWQSIGSSSMLGVIADIAISTSNPNQLWEVGNDGVAVSNDQGTTWTQTGMGTPLATIVLDPSDAATAYAGTSDGRLYRTADGGTTWTEITSNLAVGFVRTIAIDPAQRSTLLAGGNNGLSATSTTGASWAASETGIAATTVLGFSTVPGVDRIYSVVAYKGLFYLDAGADATTAVNNGALAQLSAPILNWNPQGLLAQSAQLLTSLSTGVAQSADGGATWSLLPTPLQAAGQVLAFASSPATPQTILAGTLNGAWRSTDGGKSWTAASAGLPASTAVGAFWIAPSDPTIVYTAPYPPQQTIPTTGYGVFVSHDGGQTWSADNAGMTASVIASLTVDPTNPQLVYVASGANLLKTVDGGTSWNTMTTDPTLGYPSVVAVDSSRPQTLYVAGESSLARSVDGGTNWQTVRAANVMPLWEPNALIVDPMRPADILVATSGVGIQMMTLAPDLALQATGPNGTVVGTSSTYAFTYTATNKGPFDATGVKIAAQFPAGMTNVTATASDASAVCSVSAAQATCTFPVVRTSEMPTMMLSMAVSSAGSSTVSASISGDQPDPDSSNNSVSDTPVLTPPTTITGGSGGGSGGGGGGGAISPLTLLVLGMIVIAAKSRWHGGCVSPARLTPRRLLRRPRLPSKGHVIYPCTEGDGARGQQSAMPIRAYSSISAAPSMPLRCRA
jgi:uncharacterized repeat protein (TIGR01451 family)